MKHLPKITIKELPLSKMRFTTAGDWLARKNTLEIQLVKLKDWRYSFIVLLHELVEWAWCMYHGVTSKECDDFDALWEKELKQGLHKPEEEAGCDKRCPYYMGHFFGIKAEMFGCILLGIKWRTYCLMWDEYFQNL